MGAGRKPLPTNLKVIRGTAQPCRINQHEPKPSADKIVMPRDLSPEAKKEWRRIVPLLKASKIMTNLDVRAVQLYCESYARWRKAMDMIQDTPSIVRTPNGHLMVNPWVTISNKEFEKMKSIMIEFGMTPSSRARVKTTDAKPKGDGWDQF